MPFIGRIRLDGTHHRPHWLEIEEEISRMTSDGTHVFYAGLLHEDGTTPIGKVNVDGTGLDEDWAVLSGLTNDYYVQGICTDGTYVYLMVVETETEGANAERAFITRIKISNGAINLEWHTASIDALFQQNTLACGAGHLYWVREISVEKSWVARMKTDGTELEPEWIEIGEGFHPPLSADANFLWGKADNGLVIADLSEPTPSFEPFWSGEEFFGDAGVPTATHVYVGVVKEEAPGSATGTSEEGYVYYGLTEWEVEEEEKEERAETSTKFVRLKRTDGTDQGHFSIKHSTFAYAVVPRTFEEPDEEEGGEEPPEEEPTNVVKVRVGGTLVDGRRYVKVGGELVPA